MGELVVDVSSENRGLLFVVYDSMYCTEPRVARGAKRLDCSTSLPFF